MIFRLSTPIPEVAFAWGSKSQSSTFLPRSVKAAVRFTAVVVLPTPPFWFTMAMIFPIFRSSHSPHRNVSRETSSDAAFSGK